MTAPSLTLQINLPEALGNSQVRDEIAAIAGVLAKGKHKSTK
jgi:hypothetical protein